MQQVKTMKKKVARWWWWLSWWWCCLCFCCWRSIGRCMDGEPQLRRRPRRRSDEEEEEEAVSSRGDCGFESELERCCCFHCLLDLASSSRRRRSPTTVYPQGATTNSNLSFSLSFSSDDHPHHRARCQLFAAVCLTVGSGGDGVWNPPSLWFFTLFFFFLFFCTC